MNQIKQGTNGKFEKRTKKNKFLKTTAVAVMACFMGLLTILSGCAPTNANSNIGDSGSLGSGANGGVVQSAPSPLGLDPENDPVIYTTESGLEIKFGGLDIESSLASGALTGYPYFTMGTYSGYPVNWVIIGQNPNDVILSETINTFLFSAWKSGNQYQVGSVQTKAYYFFNNIFETNSPAGAAINAVTPSKSYVADFSINTKPTKNTEVPQGTVLALSEYCLGTSIFAEGSTQWSYCPLYQAMTTLYNTGLGLTDAQKALVQKQTLQTRYYDVETGRGVVVESTENYFWGLAYNQYSENLQNFYVESYIKSNALRIGCTYRTTTKTNWWLRTMGNSKATGEPQFSAFYTNTSGGIGYIDRNTTYGVRPACIVKLT